MIVRIKLIQKDNNKEMVLVFNDVDDYREETYWRVVNNLVSGRYLS